MRQYDGAKWLMFAVVCAIAVLRCTASASASDSMQENYRYEQMIEDSVDQAMDETETAVLTEEYMKQLEIDYGEIEEEMGQLFGGALSFEELVGQLVSGEQSLDTAFFKECVSSLFLKQFADTKGLLLQIIVIGAVSAIFTISVSAFGNEQTAEVSFYIIFLLLIVVLMKSFLGISGILETTVSRMMAFCKVLMPVYVLVVAVAGSVTTAVVFYEFFLFLVYVIEWLVVYGLLPLISSFVVLGMINQLSKEDLFSKMAEFLKTTVGWILKTLLGLVIGFQVLQSLLTPYMDQFRTASVHKALQAIPGIGGTLNAATEMMVGSGILIKNGIGTAALIVLLLLCASPVITLFLYAVTYQLSRALIQPIVESRVGKCVECVQDGAWLLLRTMLMVCLLLFLTIAILAASTNLGM